MPINDDELITPENIASMQSILDDEALRSKGDFNGVMGSMPEWVPDFHKNKFITIRNNLLNDTRGFDGEFATEENIIKWIDSHEAGIYEYPFDLRDQIGTLFQYRHAVKLGEIEGLRLLAGDYAVLGTSYSEEQSERAKQPRKLTKSNKESIWKRHQLAEKEGNLYGLFKELSRQYDVSTRTIFNVIKKFKEMN